MKYKEGHSFPIGDGNILSEETRLRMVEMVRWCNQRLNNVSSRDRSSG